jgi:hypothetical protein
MSPKYPRRKVEVVYRYNLYNVSLEGEGKYKGNSRLSLFSLTYTEAQDLIALLKRHMRNPKNKKNNEVDRP